MCNLTAPHFHDKDLARKYLENLRWPDGPICPHCGGIEKIYTMKSKKARAGLYKCGDCRQQFTVTVGSLFSDSKVPLNKWLMAVFLMCSSKKGISSHQLHRMLNVTYKTAWFMTHRIREAMKDPVFTKLGGNGGIVEVDETFWGNCKPKGQKKGRGYHHKEKIFSLVERGGEVRSFHVPSVSGKTLRPIMREQIDASAHVMTDEGAQYIPPRNQHGPNSRRPLEDDFAKHSYVNHSHGEYSRGPIHTNTIESYFSILKRGLVGTFHHVGAQHLKRYIGEFDFRYNNRHIDDVERADKALKGIAGKRLLYGGSH